MLAPPLCPWAVRERLQTFSSTVACRSVRWRMAAAVWFMALLCSELGIGRCVPAEDDALWFSQVIVPA